MKRIDFVQAVASSAFAATLPKTHPASWDRLIDDTALPLDQPLEITVELLDAGAKSFKLSDYRGKPVLLNNFASWCGDCVNEQPRLNKIVEQHRDDLVVVGLNWKEPDEIVRGYRKGFNLTYPIAMDRNGSVTAALQRTKSGGRMLYFPTTFFFRPDGSLYGIVRDGISGDELEYRVAKFLADSTQAL